jgi:hypothetical protein
MELKHGQVLTKVHRYRLDRSRDHVNIEVHEVVAGSSEKFIAWPVEGLNMASTNKALHIKGRTENEALANLINKIKDLRAIEIFPQDSESKYSFR